MTAGQAAGRSGRDPQHVALSSLAAFTPSIHIFSVILDPAQPWQLFKSLLNVLGAD